MEKELEVLGGILASPAHPFAELIGGAKVSDKISLLENTIDKVDSILIGGGMAATFLKAKSYEVGLSLVELDMLDLMHLTIVQATTIWLTLTALTPTRRISQEYS